MRRLAVAAGLLAVVSLLGACGASDKKQLAANEIPIYNLKVIKTYPHDTTAFTQGLTFEDGMLYEGTGQRGSSNVRLVELETGKVLRRHDLGDEYFGEGLAIVGERLVQLTWTTQTGFVYDKRTLEPTGEFQYLTEGWGLTYDGSRLIMSDGSSNLQFLDPLTYEYKGFVTVRAGDVPVQRLNELEFVDGEVFANVWPGSRIARIDPSSGAVVGWIEASGLFGSDDYTGTIDVLNGIAWDATGKRLFLTGKLWPTLYEVELVPVAPEQR